MSCCLLPAPSNKKITPPQNLEFFQIFEMLSNLILSNTIVKTMARVHHWVGFTEFHFYPASSQTVSSMYTEPHKFKSLPQGASNLGDRQRRIKKAEGNRDKFNRRTPCHFISALLWQVWRPRGWHSLRKAKFQGEVLKGELG